MTSLFISHNHKDKPFVRRLGADLSALGVRVWIDEAEIKIGESLISKISRAIDDMDFLAVVLSPNSVSSNWVQEELYQALDMQISSKMIKVLPILLIDCPIPGFLRNKLYADFRTEQGYSSSLQKLLLAMGVDTREVYGSTIHDPFASQYNRLKTQYTRPKIWHCIICGWRCEEDYNDYICKQCNTLRTFAGGSATMVECRACKQWSLARASYCEWCGEKFQNKV
jgi:hypothetical protein